MSEMSGFFKVGDRRGESGNKCVKGREVSPEDFHEDTKIVPKYRNCLKFLNHRELGATAGVQAEKEYYLMKTSHKEKISSAKLSIPFSYDSCEVSVLNGDDDCMFGIWRLRNNCERNSERNVLGVITYSTNNDDYLLVREDHQNIIDLCRASGEFLTLNQSSPLLPSNVRRHSDEEPTWYCCCFVHRSDSAVFGGDGHILVVNDLDYERTITKFDAKIYSASYNPESSIMLFALDTGELCITDYRTLDSEVRRKDLFCIKISDKAVNDSIFLSDKEVIITDIQGKLVKVDLRARKISATFFGHKHSVTKRPFSVANNMLCATGADNVVRIWHTSGGHPIHVHKSTSGHEVRGWLSSDGNKTYLNYFERDTRTVFTF